MKTPLLILVALFFGRILTPLVADPSSSYDPAPLPPGPILANVPDFSAWRIDYSYASQGAGPNGSASSNAGISPTPTNSHLPKTLSITHTKPLWHAVMVDLSGAKNETWYDGTTRYEQASDPSKFIPISNGNPDAHALKSYFTRGQEFPDVEWVSPGTYLGTEKASGFWVFQQPGEGAMLWVNPATRFPVRWTKGGETRVFEVLPTPTGLLTLPPSVARISQALKHLDDLSRVAPPHI